MYQNYHFYHYRDKRSLIKVDYTKIICIYFFIHFNSVYEKIYLYLYSTRWMRYPFVSFQWAEDLCMTYVYI